jgi:hypothetical protein
MSGRCTVEKKDTIPLWLAVAITVVVSLPFGLWLGQYNIPLWVAFITWAEYFALGARPEVLKTMVPAYLIGVVETVLILTLTTWFINLFGDAKIYTAGDLAIAAAFFIGFCVAIYTMRYIPVVQGANTLPFFNGITMCLAVFFTGATGWIAANGAGVDQYLIPTIGGIGAALGGLLGAVLGWFNVTILFPREVSKGS